ncbi:hypothetical protein BDY21DRAFT_95775 [Lineolata rhizophorae]|uniref:Uncharacterized protein n=1 Tax=Lineolata rhizophorae TaxID=578093 RepID=A0A6A6NSX2_9PEZI|nr:hypothetical protein BDY21DRAFT_95775 [Lineolata rhizophorae]
MTRKALASFKLKTKSFAYLPTPDPHPPRAHAHGRVHTTYFTFQQSPPNLSPSSHFPKIPPRPRPNPKLPPRPRGSAPRVPNQVTHHHKPTCQPPNSASIYPNRTRTIANGNPLLAGPPPFPLRPPGSLVARPSAHEYYALLRPTPPNAAVPSSIRSCPNPGDRSEISKQTPHHHSRRRRRRRRRRNPGRTEAGEDKGTASASTPDDVSALATCLARMQHAHAHCKATAQTERDKGSSAEREEVGSLLIYEESDGRRVLQSHGLAFIPRRLGGCGDRLA